jgi:hypothetical protein
MKQNDTNLKQIETLVSAVTDLPQPTANDKARSETAKHRCGPFSPRPGASLSPQCFRVSMSRIDGLHTEPGNADMPQTRKGVQVFRRKGEPSQTPERLNAERRE